MPDQLLLDVCSVLIRYVVQQVADTPCHMYLFCVLEVRTRSEERRVGKELGLRC